MRWDSMNRSSSDSSGDNSNFTVLYQKYLGAVNNEKCFKIISVTFGAFILYGLALKIFFISCFSTLKRKMRPHMRKVVHLYKLPCS